MSEVSLKNILTEIPVRESFPRVDWEKISLFLAENPPAKPHETWLSLAREWTKLIADSLGGKYSIHESMEFIFVSSQSTPQVKDAFAVWESSRVNILHDLAGIAEDEGFGKHVVFDFSTAEIYYSYMCDYDEDEGEFGASQGCFIPAAYGHFALSPGEINDRSLITHELTHALLRHLPLPLWIDEGLAEIMGTRAVGEEIFMDRALFGEHQAYWHKHGLNDFWGGASFLSATEGQELSYSLASVLISRLLEVNPETFREFVLSASDEDAGESAARDSFVIGLGDIAAGFLGEGEWGPDLESQ